jgi:hypothetical protein
MEENNNLEWRRRKEKCMTKFNKNRIERGSISNDVSDAIYGDSFRTPHNLKDFTKQPQKKKTEYKIEYIEFNAIQNTISLYL